MSQSTKYGAAGRKERPVPMEGRTSGWCRLALRVPAGLVVLVAASVALAKPPAGHAPAVKTSVNAVKTAAPAAGSAVFLVRVIEAKKGAAPKIDPRLAKMKREFRPFLGQFNQFTLVRDQTLRLGINQAGKVALPTGKRFGITMLGFAAGKVRRVRYEVHMPRMRMKRSVAPGARTLDVIRNGAKLTIVSTTVR